MSIYLKPGSRTGIYAVVSLAAFLFSLSALYLFIAMGQRGPDVNIYLLIPTVCAGVSGVLALIFGLIAIIRNREHSLAVIVATLIGFLVLLFALAEVIFPH